MPAYIGLGECLVDEAGPTPWIIYGLGSCVGLILVDPATGVSAMAHIVLPEGPRRSGIIDPTGACRFADTAVPHLLARMGEFGADKGRIVAQMAGGSRMLAMGTEEDHIGRRNVEATGKALKKSSIPLVARDVGGNRERTLLWKRREGVALVRRGGSRSLKVLTPPAYRLSDAVEVPRSLGGDGRDGGDRQWFRFLAAQTQGAEGDRSGGVQTPPSEEASG